MGKAKGDLSSEALSMRLRSPFLYVRSLLAFLRERPIGILATIFFTLLGYSLKIFGNSYSVDTQMIIADQQSMYQSWIVLDRPILVWLKEILGVAWYNNALHSFLTVVVFCCAALSWAYMWYVLQGRPSEFNLALYTIPIVTSMIFAEQLGFLLQGFEIALLLVFIPLAVLWTVRAAYATDRFTMVEYCCGIVAICTVAFGSYMAFITVFVFAIATAVFLYRPSSLVSTKQDLADKAVDSTSDNVVERSDYRTMWKIFILGIVNTVVAYACYMLITVVALRYMYHANTSDYIDEQMRWGKDNLHTIIYNILVHAKTMIFAEKIHYFLINTIVFIVFTIVVIVLFARRRIHWLQVVAGLGIVVSPMMMSVLLGGYTPIRTEFTYSLAFAFVVGYLLSCWHHHAIVSWFALIVIIAVGFAHANTVNRLFYTENVTYQHDVATTRAIAQDIRALPHVKASTPVVFVGNIPTQQVNADAFDPQQYDLVGRSILSIGFNDVHGDQMKHSFFTSIGEDFPMVSDNKLFEESQKIAKTMPVWPQNGSVVLKNGVVVVKLQ